MASRVFAVDLGAWSVKVAIASPGIRGATLINIVERLVPPGDEPTEVRAKQVLASLVSELRLGDESGYIGVYGDQVFSQILEFGFKNLRRAELDKAVGGELEGVVPVDLEDMVYCFEPIPSVAPQVPGEDPLVRGRGRVAPPAEGMRVLSYAMRRDRAEQVIQLGLDCGFDARGILACGGAAVKLVERMPSLVRARNDGAVAVIDIGHERTDVVVVANGKAVFSRSVARAGKQITEAIARTWTLSFEAAEQAKHSDGFVASQAEPATNEAWLKIHNVTVAELQPFARDLRQTLAACRARTGVAVLAAVVVGGGSRLRGMASYLGEQLAIPVWRLTSDDIVALAGPRIGAEAAPQRPIESAAMTIGMAYDCAGGRPMFDLRSGSLAVRVDLSFLRAKAVPLGGAVLAIAACAAGAAAADLYRLKKAEKTLTARLQEDTIAHYGVAKSADDVLGTNSGTGIANAANSPIPKMSAYDVMLEISNRIPARDKIQLDLVKLDILPDKIDINGYVKTGEEVDLFINEIKKIECFKDVTAGPRSTEKVNDVDLKKFSVAINSQCM
ncbi:MAG TPA: pilus assembly protein PilM [Kofleriaceae bacterium]|nr:pilus assembly protein PilM [Kofleriaceae bacterium]